MRRTGVPGLTGKGDDHTLNPVLQRLWNQYYKESRYVLVYFSLEKWYVDCIGLQGRTSRLVDLVKNWAERRTEEHGQGSVGVRAKLAV